MAASWLMRVPLAAVIPAAEIWRVYIPRSLVSFEGRLRT